MLAVTEQVSRCRWTGGTHGDVLQLCAIEKVLQETTAQGARGCLSCAGVGFSSALTPGVVQPDDVAGLPLRVPLPAQRPARRRTGPPASAYTGP